MPKVNTTKHARAALRDFLVVRLLGPAGMFTDLAWQFWTRSFSFSLLLITVLYVGAVYY